MPPHMLPIHLIWCGCRRLGARSQESFGSETMARIAGYCFVAVILASIGATVASLMPLP